MGASVRTTGRQRGKATPVGDQPSCMCSFFFPMFLKKFDEKNGPGPKFSLNFLKILVQDTVCVCVMHILKQYSLLGD